MMQRGTAVLAALLFAALVPVGFAGAQDQAPPTVSKQEMARTKFRDLTERMQKLMIVLQKNDTDANAATDASILPGRTYRRSHDRSWRAGGSVSRPGSVVLPSTHFWASSGHHGH